jgi:hypothetical protein
MKISPYTSVAASGLCLITALFAIGIVNRGREVDNLRLVQQLKSQQEQIDRGNSFSEQLGLGSLVPPPRGEVGSHRQNILQDMAIASFKDEQMKELLEKHGYRVNYRPDPGSSPAPASNPSKTPAIRP